MFPITPGDRLTLPERREALALLFDGMTEVETRVRLALEAFENGELDPAGLLACPAEDGCAGVLVAEVMPGNSASLWPVRARPGPDRTRVEDDLYAQALRFLRGRAVKFAQTFLPPGQPAAGEALRRNGFTSVTRMWHMRGDLPPWPAWPDRGVRFEPLAEADPEVFRDTLMATFEASLDCPELNGLRGPDEVLAGHVAGAPDLSRWWLARAGGEPAGVLILAESDASACWDLAYLGVAPGCRRRGIGRALVEFAVRQAGDAGATTFKLLVDERNGPAIDLYKSYGFRMVDVREVYLRTGLSGEPRPSGLG